MFVFLVLADSYVRGATFGLYCKKLFKLCVAILRIVNVRFYMPNKKIAVIGGDKRLFYLSSELRGDGFTVSAVGNEWGTADIDEALENSDVAVLPFPISPDGVYLNSQSGGEIRLAYLFEKIREHNVKRVFGGAVSPAVSKIAEDCGIFICDYGKMETVALKNALCTSEGAIQIAFEKLPVTVHSSTITVLGYGRIGRILSCELKALGAKVRAVARKNEDIAKMQIDGIKPYSFKELQDAVSGSVLIYNTVPYPVLDKNILLSLKNPPLIIDLASAPGGVDRSAAESLGINVIWALSLPGKVAPKSAALIIKEEILRALAE